MVHSPSLVQDSGPGSTSSGPDAILGFQYAYYVLRSGVAARQYVSPDSSGLVPSTIQAGIDSAVPVGTTHCVRVTPVSATSFSVVVTEHRPTGDNSIHLQVVDTRTDAAGRALITRISTA
ncbi:hypothetical protein GCM10007304_14260 [Rhodococcoides trifolii]|uniref:DUF8176 domain-containing protein n=1 Tax=Rhodococcoides trifolii TaxID=908250 RepID=A0A917CX32_9NOCA|nr:hypothetical protein [Rhodococcus trifolii]GGG01427.1 hypothetical protein GCM10007304_14260 [Rhodococcus trifolii]